MFCGSKLYKRKEPSPQENKAGAASLSGNHGHKVSLREPFLRLFPASSQQHRSPQHNLERRQSRTSISNVVNHQEPQRLNPDSYSTNSRPRIQGPTNTTKMGDIHPAVALIGIILVFPALIYLATECVCAMAVKCTCSIPCYLDPTWPSPSLYFLLFSLPSLSFAFLV